MREAAAYVCEHKPRSKDAAAMLRRWRGKGRGPGPCGVGIDLFVAITKCIDDFRATHQPCALKDIRIALMNVDDAIREAEEAEQEEKKGKGSTS